MKCNAAGLTVWPRRVQAFGSSPSAAEPRPNAYIPEELGIPKPYGQYAPFKPSVPGATMRHTRKPEPREIVL